MSNNKPFPQVTDPKQLRSGDIFRAVLTSNGGIRKQMLYKVLFNPDRDDNLKEHRSIKYIIQLLYIFDKEFPPAKTPEEYYNATGRLAANLQYVDAGWFVKRSTQLVTWHQ